MRTLIYSFLALDTSNPLIDYPLQELIHLWHRHLRGPGQYTGDLMLFTNCTDLGIPDIITKPLLEGEQEARNIFYARVLNYPNVPADQYDVILQMDLDILAVHNVSPLFQLTAPFQAATSGLKLYDPSHVGNPRCFPFDFWKKYLPNQQERQAVSACLFACQGTEWNRCMSAWSKLARQHQHKPLTYHDQTLLNLAYARRSFPIHPYPQHFILHQNWHITPETILLHFPMINRLETMQKFSRI